MEVGLGKSLLDYYLPLPGNAFFASPKKKKEMCHLLAFMCVGFGARGANRPHMCVWRLGPRGGGPGGKPPTHVCVVVGVRRRMGLGKIQNLETRTNSKLCV